MTLFQAYLLGFGSALTGLAGAALVYLALALPRGWRTPSGVLSKANALQGALLGLLVGLVLGGLFGHWWWPVVGN